MPFYAPSWVPKLPSDPPWNVSIPEFIFSDSHGRQPLARSRPFFTCGFTGKKYTPLQAKERVERLASGIGKEFGWAPNKGTEWDKVAAIFSLNTIDTCLVMWAIHRQGGVCTPANAAYSAGELEHQMRDSGARHIFTCLPLLQTTLQICDKLGLPHCNIYILELPTGATNGQSSPPGFKTVDDLVGLGKTVNAALERLDLGERGGGRRCAYLCYSSGTSGLPKGVMISHRNVISNVIQYATFESPFRRKMGLEYSENVLGLLPFSHIYGLVVTCHAAVYQGDGVIVLPKFEFTSCMKAIQNFKINTLYLVPPIIIQMVNNAEALRNYDLSSVTSIFTGAAPLGAETMEDLNRMYPSWLIRQGYGLTETCTVISSTARDDIMPGSSGSIWPGYEVKLVTQEGIEIEGYDQPGEVWAKSPSVVLGYLHNDKANKETFVDGFMRTGDEGLIRRSQNGKEHLFIVDRIKELIKVQGFQVAPAELEAHLLAHSAVADCTVIPVPDDQAGERPKAFVVKKPGGALEESDQFIARDIKKHVEKHKTRHKWLKEVEFVDAIPKSPSGKILRRLLKDKDKESRRQAGARL